MLDEATEAFVRRVHHTWDNDSPLSAYVPLRDDLLVQFVGFDAQVASLSTVISAVKQRSEDEEIEDEGWNSLFSLASRLDRQNRIDEEKDVKRKRAYNTNFRTRNLAVIASFWSLDVVRYYGWESASHGQMNLMRKCAIRYPHFSTDFCVQLNKVLLRRHRETIRTGRGKSLYEAPLQPQKDFRDVLMATLEEQDSEIMLWTTNQDGRLEVDTEGTLLSSLRPQHFHLYLLRRDYYGMLAPRKEDTDTTFEHINAGQFPSDNVPQVLLGRLRESRSLSASGTCQSIASAAEATEAVRSPLSVAGSEPSAFGRASYSPGSIGEDEELCLSAHIASMQTSVFSSSPERYPDPDPEAHGSVADGSELQIETENGSLCGESSSPGDVEADEGGSSMFGSDKSRSPGLQSTSPCTSALAEGRGRSNTPWPVLDPIEACASDASQGTAHALRQRTSQLRPQDPHISLSKNSRDGLMDPSSTIGEIYHGTLESQIYRKHYKMIASYIEKLSNELERHPHNSAFAVRAEWLRPKSKLASIWTSSDSGLPHGSVSDPADAEVLYYSADDFVMDAQAGRSFRKPVVIKEHFTDTGIHTVKSFCDLIQGTRSDCKVDIRKLGSKLVHPIPVQEFVRQAHAHGDTGLNALNFRCITKAHRSILTMLPRFRLLETLTERLSGDVGKENTILPQDVSSCVDFNILGLAGSFSGPHLDALGGTWIRTLEGVKFWMIVPEHEMRSEWDAFAELGDDWLPGGKERLIVLEQDDVLLMPPGTSVIHAAHSPTRCLMQGGMLWDYHHVIETLNSISWICRHQPATNEAIPHELPGVLEELANLVQEHTNRFPVRRSGTDFLDSFKDVVYSFHDLGCQCRAVRCAQNCTCRKANRRCTSWCVKHSNTTLRKCMIDGGL